MSGQERTFHVPASLAHMFDGMPAVVRNEDGSATFTAREGCVMPHDGSTCPNCDWVKA